jgi:hypothetical protein
MKKHAVFSEKRLALSVTGLGPFVRLDAGALDALAPRFKKDVLRAGRWVHPGTGEALEFDLPLLERLAQDTNRWIALGHKVHFPAGPDCHEEDARDATKNLGYWSNFRVEDARLVADVSVLDPEAEKKIGKTIQDVSPEIRWPARSATGETLKAAIFHVAATPIPAIPGQENFERLSRLAREVPMEEGTPAATGTAPQQPTQTFDVFAWARAKLGLPKDASDQAVIEALEQRIDQAAEQPTSDPSALTQLTREVNDARAEAQSAKKLAAELKEQHVQEKKKRDEETVQVARRSSALAGFPIPESSWKLALSLFTKGEDEAAREILHAHSARANDWHRPTSVRVLEAPPPETAEHVEQLSRDKAEALLLEGDGFTAKRKKDGSLKRDANGRPVLVRRTKGEK